jgi:hypothetical protein
VRLLCGGTPCAPSPWHPSCWPPSCWQWCALDLILTDAQIAKLNEASTPALNFPADINTRVAPMYGFHNNNDEDEEDEDEDEEDKREPAVIREPDEDE